MLKYLSSFLWEQPVEKTGSLLNPFLEITYDKGDYKLSTPHAIYSFGTQYKVFADAFTMLNIASRNIKTVLSLGFGMGSIPLILSRQLKEYTITGIEADATIIELAKKYLPPEILNKTTLICSDANDYVRACPSLFDLITVDIFIDDEVPEKFEQKEFLISTARLLNKNGLLLYNRLGLNENQRKKSLDLFHHVFKEVFPAGRLLTLNKNILLASKQ